VKTAMDQFGSSEHAFDMDAEPEPLPVDCGAGVASAADAGMADEIVYDGFGPVADDDEYNDEDDDTLRGIVIIIVCPMQYLAWDGIQESPADARVMRDSAVIPRWRQFQDGRQPPSWILSIRKYRHSIRRPRKP